MHKYKLDIKEIKTAKELDLSNKELSILDAIVIAALMKVYRLYTLLTKRDKTKRNSFQDNGALAKMTIGESKTPATLEIGMTEGNFSGAGLGPGGALILASWIEHK